MRPLNVTFLLTALLIWPSPAAAQGVPQIDWEKLREYVGKAQYVDFTDGQRVEGSLVEVTDDALQINVKKSTDPRLRSGLTTFRCEDVAGVRWNEYRGPMRKWLTILGAIGGTVAAVYAETLLKEESDGKLLLVGAGFGGLGGFYGGRRLDREQQTVRVDTQLCTSARSGRP
jgi:hypothetical protein